MVQGIRSIAELQRKGADLIVTCAVCGHRRTVAIEQVVRIFYRRAWPTDWQQAHTRFRCHSCGAKAVELACDFVGFAARQERMKPNLSFVDETLRPGLRPLPIGVSLAIWNRASERERKRLVDRSRS